MIDVQSVIFERNNQSLIIHIGNESKVSYKDISKIVDKEEIFKYLESLFRIIDHWEEEYIDTKIIDGDDWRLSIVYLDGKKKEYYGKAEFPTNFEALERLSQKLVYEV